MFVIWHSDLDGDNAKTWGGQLYENADDVIYEKEYLEDLYEELEIQQKVWIEEI